MPTAGVPRIDSGFENLEPRPEAEVLPPYEPAVPIRTLGRFTAEERGVEAQHKRYFGDKGHWKSRFKLLLDPNGLETFDSLELVLDGNRSARIGAVWSKQQVFETVGSIYKRIDSFLETIRHQGYTQPFAKWEVTFQKKSRKDIESSEWWVSRPRVCSEVWQARLDETNRRNYAKGGWTSQIRIILAPHSQPGAGVIALSSRGRYRSINGMGIPVVRFKKTGGPFSLLVRTPASNSNQVYLDRWCHSGDDVYKARQGPLKRTKSTFVWTWGLDDPFSAQQRLLPGRKALPAFTAFTTPFRASPKPSKAITFSDPCSIEVWFDEPEADNTSQTAN